MTSAQPSGRSGALSRSPTAARSDRCDRDREVADRAGQVAERQRDLGDRSHDEAGKTPSVHSADVIHPAIFPARLRPYTRC